MAAAAARGPSLIACARASLSAPHSPQPRSRRGLGCKARSHWPFRGRRWLADAERVSPGLARPTLARRAVGRGVQSSQLAQSPPASSPPRPPTQSEKLDPGSTLLDASGFSTVPRAPDIGVLPNLQMWRLRPYTSHTSVQRQRVVWHCTSHATRDSHLASLVQVTLRTRDLARR